MDRVCKPRYWKHLQAGPPSCMSDWNSVSGPGKWHLNCQATQTKMARCESVSFACMPTRLCVEACIHGISRGSGGMLPQENVENFMP